MRTRNEEPNLIFLKLGGSLITDKDRPHTARADVLLRAAQEIARARAQNPAMQLLLGHGSGSFGHVPARRHSTRQGVQTQEQWLGFVEVWQEAIALNRLVMQALQDANVPAIAFAPSAGLIAENGRIASWNTAGLQTALQAGIVPVVYGDVAFDLIRGGTIVSTEEIFEFLAFEIHPKRILLAGQEPGVWADYPARSKLLAEITPQSFQQAAGALAGSSSVDVTGGMESKVEQSLRLVDNLPQLKILIFSGLDAGNIHHALCGDNVGTLLYNQEQGGDS